MPRPLALLLILSAALLPAAGCESDPAAPPGNGDPNGDDPPPGVTPTLALVAEGLGEPVDLSAPPGVMDRVFVVEREGRIRIIRDGSLLPTPFLDIRSRVGSGGELGLLGLAFHPRYAENGRFYLHYTDRSGNSRVARFTVGPNPERADPDSEFPILEVSQPADNHNGGQLAFGPDGYLYIAMGDGGGGGDPFQNGQDRSTLLGAVLRIDVDGGNPYAVPPDNPFVGQAGARPEIWAWGLRNPWRFSFDRETGDLYIADVGQSAREEVNVQPSGSPGGENYGWNTMEGTLCYNSSQCDTQGLTLPVYEYVNSQEGCSITGGYVYRGSALPALRGHYFFGDFCRGWIRSFRLQGGEATEVTERFTGVPQLTSFGEDGAGELYVLSLQGRVYRMVPQS